MTYSIPLTPAMIISDFIEDWLHEPDDWEVFLGHDEFETHRELGQYLKDRVISLIEQDADHFSTTGRFEDGRTIGIALDVAWRQVHAIDPEQLGAELWDDYLAMDEEA